MITLENLSILLQSILPKMEWLLIAIILDLILGIAIALKEHIFQWQKVAEFLETYGLKILGWLTLETLTLLPKEFTGNIIIEGSAWIAYIAIITSALASIAGHVGSIGIIQEKFGFLFKKAGIPIDNEDDCKYG